MYCQSKVIIWADLLSAAARYKMILDVGAQKIKTNVGIRLGVSSSAK